MFKKAIFAIPILASAGIAAAQAVPLESEDRCYTKKTGLDGKRHDCNVYVCVTAPYGYAIDQNSLTKAELEGDGSEHYCTAPYISVLMKFAVTLQDGSVVFIDLPTQACVQGHARSHHGHNGNPGHVVCKIT